ncbi:MAG: hypothetical protein K6E50_02915 [Lachnospiraceae bacterium]|nr:hypothetical protein [Lachnospiraceae bacterium]
MESVTINVGTVLHTAADKADCLELVTSGKVEIISPDFHITAERGSILGLFEMPRENYSYTYIAKETCTLDRYPFRRRSDTDAIVRDRISDSDRLVCANASITLSLLGHYKRSQRRVDTLLKALRKGYSGYRSFCESNSFDIQPWPLVEELENFTPEKELPDWLGDYYDQLGLMPQDIRSAFYSSHTSITTAAILEAVGHIRLIRGLFDQLSDYSNNIRETYFSGPDLFDLYLNLRRRCNGKPELQEQIDSAVEDYDKSVSRTELLTDNLLEERRLRYENGCAGSRSQKKAEAKPAEEMLPESEAPSPAEEISIQAPETPETPEVPEAPDPLAVLDRSLDQILACTQLDEAEEDRFRQLLEAYKSINDKNSSDNAIRQLRHDIGRGFFNLYESAVLAAMESRRGLPVPVKLFLYFGYMDEELIGRDNCAQLLRLLDRIEEMKEAAEEESESRVKASRVYTIYDWLAAIYRGEKDPSRNEFDQDYPTWLKSRRQSGEISEDQEKRYLDSPRERMRFELDNFLHLSMRIASGRPTVFCPLLSAHNIIRPLEQMLVTAESIQKNWETIRSVDFSLFFRLSLYQNSAYNLPRESIQIEVFPDMILLPMVGVRGGLWQEISGVRRDTPARMYLPVFCGEDLFLQQIKMAASFRWAICRRVQGARWNDVSDPSLTADYNDYLQFYKKNSDLSSDAKEKVKAEIQACKNSYESVFLLDYVQWMRFESQGAPRLTKVARRILFSYCPFSAKVRKNLENNPMYTDLVRRYENQATKSFKLMHLKYDKVEKQFGSLPPEIEDLLHYYES